MPTREQLMGQIAKVLWNAEPAYEKADRILALDGLRIEDDDQSLPQKPFAVTLPTNEGTTTGFADLLQEELDSMAEIVEKQMLNEGFVKCLPREVD